MSASPETAQASLSAAEDEHLLEYAMDDDAAAPSTVVRSPWSALDLCAERRRLLAPLSSTGVGATPSRATEGSTVIAYETRVAMAPLYLKRGQTYGNRFGTFHHADLIDQPLGSKQRARATKGKTASNGWVALLPFAPDLWTLSLTHRTQILYQADIAYVLFGLDCKAGDVILESGTGSGSLTTALATAVAPHGHVHTFEFNSERVRKARVDFANNGLGDLITVRERDVVGQGFPLVEGGANAVFLDLPAPWAVVESAARALRHQGRICSFSPCIEQVQRTCLRLDALGFSEIFTCEILLRSFEVQPHQSWPIAKPQVWKPRQQYNKRPLEQSATTAAGAAEPAAAGEEGDATKKRRNEAGEAVVVPAAETASAAPATTATDAAATATPAAAPTEAAPAAAAPAVSPTPAPTAAATPAPAAPVGPVALSYITTKPYQLMRGHTGYLTFAVCNKF